MDSIAISYKSVWKQPNISWAFMFIIASLLAFTFWEGLVYMVNSWSGSEEYSHGFLIAPIAAFLIWQKKDELERIDFRGAWFGVLVV